MRWEIRGRGEVTAIAVACTDQIRRTDRDTETERQMERERTGDVAQMRPECKRMMTAKLNDYRSADFTSGYRFERSISGNPDIDSQH